MESPDPLKAIEDLTKEVNDHIEKQGRGVFKRYPVTFALLATFGVTAVGSGFKAIVDEIGFLSQRPGLLLLVGILILLFTGSLFKKLNK